jgi:tetratricopeptide (TPR) repeat protein
VKVQIATAPAWLLFLASSVAFAQTDTPDWLDQVRSVSGQINDIQATEGEFSPALIEPLIELARLYGEQDDLESETESLLRAQHIIHRNEGVLSLRQSEIVHRMSDLDLMQRDPEGANRAQELLLYLAERNYGSDSPNLLPALKELADWYTDTGQFYRARKLVDRAMDIVREQGGETDVRLVEPLLQLARIKRLQRLKSGYRQVESARDLVQDNPQVADDQRATVQASLGDAYLVGGREEKAAEAYAKVTELLGNEAANRIFEKPRIIAQSRELNRLDARRRNFEMRRDVYVMRDQDVFGSFERRSRKLSPEEVLMLESIEPEFFIVTRQSPASRYYLADVYADISADNDRELVGYPIRFLRSQLEHVLPYRLRKDEELAKVILRMTVSVNPDGTCRDIVIETPDVPTRLARLMREVLVKTKFRPKMVDGTPVKTENFTLIQRFDQ